MGIGRYGRGSTIDRALRRTSEWSRLQKDQESYFQPSEEMERIRALCSEIRSEFAGYINLTVISTNDIVWLEMTGARGEKVTVRSTEVTAEMLRDRLTSLGFCSKA